MVLGFISLVVVSVVVLVVVLLLGVIRLLVVGLELRLQLVLVAGVPHFFTQLGF